jgi:cation diffusion facilitator CzcD-associated flavoprotein CzcO
VASSDSFPALIVGAGPAGLAAAACLRQRGVDALVLEAGPALGETWRHHYDRLRLHTVKQHSHLPGMPFAKEAPRYPSRAEVVAYLEAYAAHFGIAPRTNEPVRGRAGRRNEPRPEPGTATRAGRLPRRADALRRLSKR